MDNSIDKAHSVIAMSDYQPDNGYAAIAQVEAYWEAVRGARLLPKRSDIDPRGIEHALEHAFILERVTAGVARLRIAGNHLNKLMGMEVRGMPLTSFFTPAARSSVSDLLEVVFQTPAISTLYLNSAAAAGRPALKARLLLLPLKSDLGDVSRVLGCMVAPGDMGEAPRRFDIEKKDVLHIISGSAPVPVPEFNRPDPQKKKPQLRPAALTVSSRGSTRKVGMAEDQTPFKTEGGKRTPPYLRLVKLDKD